MSVPYGAQYAPIVPTVTRPDYYNPVYSTLMHPMPNVATGASHSAHSILNISFSPWSIHAPFYDLPLPDPPAGWTMSSIETAINQSLYVLKFVHEIGYSLPVNNEKKSFQKENFLSSTPNVTVPSNWFAVSGNLKVKKTHNQYKYIYTLEYHSPLEPRVSSRGQNQHRHKATSRFDHGGDARWV